MKNLFKILALIMVFMFSVNGSFAFSLGKLDKHIKTSSLNESATVAISIKNLKDGVKYEVKDEPEPIYEEMENDGIISNSAVQLFGDIVVVE